MPTARELLEQAEALMRRDRLAAARADEEFPVLTDAVEPEVVLPGGAPIVAEVAPPLPVPIAANGGGEASAPAEVAPLPLKPPPGPPSLVSADEQGAASIWAAPANDEASIADAGPDSLSPLAIDVELPHSRGLPMNDAHALWQDDVLDAPAAGPTTLARRQQPPIPPRHHPRSTSTS